MELLSSKRRELIDALIIELPVLRARIGASQADISERIGISRQTYNAIENGKKSMPSEWISKIPELYQLNDAQKLDFDQAVAESEKGIGVKFEGLSEENKRISVAFARKIQTLSPAAQKTMRDLLF